MSMMRFYGTMKHSFHLAAVLFVLVNLAGCATSSGVIKSTTPALINQPVSLDFILVSTTSAVGNSAAERNSLNDLIISGLRDTQLFTSVSENKADDRAREGIKVAVEIKEIKKVSDDARAWFGALAGRAQIEVQVTISDLNSGNQIEVFEAEGQSGESPRAGTTDEAIQRAAGQVVAQVVRLNAQTSQ